ncbi:MAG: transposase [Planctomycetota bacterium]|nr:MAG: transposase [Planctomycetota bacterium]RLS93637.1 MAG: transposase [Planctomycetota bacterium]
MVSSSVSRSVQSLYTIRSARELCRQLKSDLRFRSFLGMTLSLRAFSPIWVGTESGQAQGNNTIFTRRSAVCTRAPIAACGRSSMSTTP